MGNLLDTPDNIVDLLRLTDRDYVVIALGDMAAGTELAQVEGRLSSAVNRGPRIATRRIPAGESVRRCGQIIGKAAKLAVCGGNAARAYDRL